jgi:hypothetical protein
MSYVRFAWDGSQVYMFEHCDGGIECCGCRFADKTGKGFPRFGTPEEAIAHLALHRRAGHFVPEYAITGLWNDIPGADEPSRPEPAMMKRSKKMMAKAREGLAVVAFTEMFKRCKLNGRRKDLKCPRCKKKFILCTKYNDRCGSQLCWYERCGKKEKT